MNLPSEDGYNVKNKIVNQDRCHVKTKRSLGNALFFVIHNLHYVSIVQNTLKFKISYFEYITEYTPISTADSIYNLQYKGNVVLIIPNLQITFSL